MSLSLTVRTCSHQGDEVDLTSNWCESHQLNVNLLSILTESTCTIEILVSRQGFWPTDLYISAQSVEKPYLGAHGAEEIPVPIPNTEVKLSSGDYTATSGKLARCRIIQ